MSTKLSPKARLILTLVALLAGAVVVHILVLVGFKPQLPDQDYKLFPPSCALGFTIDVKQALPALPAKFLDSLPSRARAFVASSRVRIACTEDLQTVYILVDDGQKLEDMAALISEEAEKTSIASYPAFTFDGGSLAELRENLAMIVLGEDARGLLEDRIRNAATEQKGLRVNLESRFSEPLAGTFFAAFGYPGSTTPVLVNDQLMSDLQRDSEFFSFTARYNESGNIQLILLLNFVEPAARNFYAMQLPTIMGQYAAQFPELSRAIKSIDSKNVKERGLQLSVVLPPEIMEAFFGSDYEDETPLPVEPRPSATPFIPDLPELPF